MCKCIKIENVKIFVIPNHAPMVGDWTIPSFQEERRAAAIEICNLNGKKFDEENDHLIETWIHCDGVSENFADHGIKIGGKRYSISKTGRYIPACLLRGNEGDEISLKVLAHEFGEDGGEEVVLDLKLTLQQKGYRYERFGEFQDVIAKVCK